MKVTYEKGTELTVGFILQLVSDANAAGLAGMKAIEITGTGCERLNNLEISLVYREEL